MKNIGIALLAIGLIMILFTGFTYLTNDKVIGFGKIELKINQQQGVNWSPFIGIAVMAMGGGVLLHELKLKR